MTEDEVREFWNEHPCGDHQVAGLAGDYEDFFRRYDAFRYAREGHILQCLDAIDFKGKSVLEIGLGQGADSEQIIRRGGLWSGVDLTRESVERVSTRLRLRELSHHALVQGSALALPFPDASFDIVFSHGVLHHIPDIRHAQAEIARVLKADGELIAMLYARRSINYLVSIGVVRRIGLALLALSGIDPGGIYGQHLRNARAIGLRRYLKMQNFVHRNTDGPLNPYSKVYSLRQVTEDFANFAFVKAYQVFMYAPPLPVRKLPLAHLLGWHLWVHMRPNKT
jgi:ubiquinone/menaquinone biosynthesis C-methylase UbiE